MFKLWLGTNHKPIIKGGDEGIWRRVNLVPCEQRFEGDSCDLDLQEKLDGELPGILTWAVRGALDWQRYGLKSVLLGDQRHRSLSLGDGHLFGLYRRTMPDRPRCERRGWRPVSYLLSMG